MCKFTNLVNEMLKLGKKPQQNWVFLSELKTTNCHKQGTALKTILHLKYYSNIYRNPILVM